MSGPCLRISTSPGVCLRRVAMETHLRTLVMVKWLMSFVALGMMCQLLLLYTLLWTRLWPLALLYYTWWFTDINTPYTGGRRSQWVRSWAIWNYLRDYFPVKLVKTCDLPSDVNLVLALHPHGVLSVGAFLNFATEATDFSRRFPGLTPHLATLPINFRMPLYRDYIMAGGRSAGGAGGGRRCRGPRHAARQAPAGAGDTPGLPAAGAHQRGVAGAGLLVWRGGGAVHGAVRRGVGGAACPAVGGAQPGGGTGGVRRAVAHLPTLARAAATRTAHHHRGGGSNPSEPRGGAVERRGGGAAWPLHPGPRSPLRREQGEVRPGPHRSPRHHVTTTMTTTSPTPRLKHAQSHLVLTTLSLTSS
ncbi:uncharacterized protein LOC142922788 isoform X2 [Petromyzon marinus]|uniref:uncharacterized protein LOC142922788 isoform X2 n=1 Tax=Petromyzon marinus TaxID=7757 RepID=UPI003F720799